jgi:hypothetical protein
LGIDVFFYGLFMDADLLRAEGISPANIRNVCVPGYALRIGQRATLVRSPGARVYGTLVELSHEEVERLYSEPSVSAYRPEAALCELSHGAGVPALWFNLVKLPNTDEVNADYAAKLRDHQSQITLPPPSHFSPDRSIRKT